MRLGLRGTWNAVRTANGPAQHIACAVVGLTYAGMFAGMVPSWIIVLWSLTSVATISSVIWFSKKVLKHILLMDFSLSMMVLTFYYMHEQPVVGFVYYSAGNMVRGYAPAMHEMPMVEMLAHGAAVVVMAVWSLSLAALVNRQILEKERFDARA